MEKVDFKKSLKHLYNPKAGGFSAVEVPTMQFLMVDGHGDPNTARSYSEALETLYAVAYKIKFAGKKEFDRDYSRDARKVYSGKRLCRERQTP